VNILYPVATAMFALLSVAYMARLALPVVAPVVAGDLNFDPALIGVYMSVVSAAAMVSVTAVGYVIERFGAVRVGQGGLVLIGSGIALSAFAWLPMFAVSAILLGLGISVCTPVTSHVVGQFCTPRQAPVIFSVKQTGVPVGGLLAGALLPFLVALVGWRAALLAAAAVVFGVALALQPLCRHVDAASRPDSRISLAGILRPLRIVASCPSLREVTFASSAFVGLQNLYATFFVTFLVHAVGHSLVAAGTMFAVAQGGAIASRILWGVAATYVPARRVLAVLALIMAAAAVLTGVQTPGWPVAGVVAVSVLFGATVFSWQGVLLAEAARLAPSGQIGAATAGLVFFNFIAMTIYPLVYAAVLKVTGSYALGFFLLGIPALATFAMLLRPAPR